MLEIILDAITDFSSDTKRNEDSEEESGTPIAQINTELLFKVYYQFY